MFRNPVLLCFERREVLRTTAEKLLTYMLNQPRSVYNHLLLQSIMMKVIGDAQIEAFGQALKDFDTKGEMNLPKLIWQLKPGEHNL